MKDERGYGRRRREKNGYKRNLSEREEMRQIQTYRLTRLKKRTYLFLPFLEREKDLSSFVLDEANLSTFQKLFHLRLQKMPHFYSAFLYFFI